MPQVTTARTPEPPISSAMKEGEERGGQGGDRRQHGVVGDGADADADLRDCRTDEDSSTDSSAE